MKLNTSRFRRRCAFFALALLAAVAAAPARGQTNFADLAGTYSGVVRPPSASSGLDTYEYDPANTGSIQVVLNSRGRATGKVRLKGVTGSFSGSFVDDALNTDLTFLGQPAVSLHLDLTPYAEPSHGHTIGITGYLSSKKGLSAKLTADRHLYSKRQPAPKAEIGAFGFRMLRASNASTAGWISGTVSKTGAVRLAGTFDDNTKFTAGGVMTAKGVPLYVPAFKKKGFLQGRLLSAETTNGFSKVGLLQRFKPAGATGGSSSEIKEEISLQGAALPSPLTSDDSVNAMLVITGADLSEELIAGLIVNGKKVKVAEENPSAIKLSLDPRKGLFSGSFRLDGRVQRFKGVLLDSADQTGVAFFGKSQGIVTLHPFSLN